MKYRVIIKGKTFEGDGLDYIGVINDKIIQANSFAQLKRKASIEANRQYRPMDTFYLLTLPGTAPHVYRRLNTKSVSGIERGQWQDNGRLV